MCGIFGVVYQRPYQIEAEMISVFEKLAILSQNRGNDSSGLAIKHRKGVSVVRGAIPVSSLLKDGVYQSTTKQVLDDAVGDASVVSLFGHARLVTNGSQLQPDNNQPVVKDNTVIVHNGIITNIEELWSQNPSFKRKYQIDTEIAIDLIRDSMRANSNDVGAIHNALSRIIGTYSIAMTFSDIDLFLLATNNGSLYYITDKSTYLVFGSEKYFLQSIARDRKAHCFNAHTGIHQLKPGEIISISLDKFNFNLTTESEDSRPSCVYYHKTSPQDIEVQNISHNTKSRELILDPSVYIDRRKEQHLVDLMQCNTEDIRNLTRCTTCILPETFPFIEFDENGVCNYCRSYKPKNQSGSLDDLLALVEPYRSKSGKQDCIVPFSGGRDSTYSLHIIKKELGLNPIAFTYDWGMVTDLARRNIARVCGKLGVENIIVSADIKWKRENIRKNIEVWLKNPSLGMIPLFMAGDKYFFYYCDQVKKRTGIKLNIWGINHLENTEFKTGFAGLPPKFDKKHIYSLSIQNQLKLFSFVGSNILKSPGYINQSVFDSLGSFAVRYLAPKTDYYHLFDYYRWDEKEINDLIMNEYHWETAIDTKSTWRIGDGTASFYNYIYYTVAGFSENDTFRSNQIREGMISREEALSLIEQDNLPRYETLRWYFEIVGIDFQKAIRIINGIPKLY